MEEKALKMVLGSFGEIRNIESVIWTHAFLYQVSNGVRVPRMPLVKHVPSHVFVAAGYRTLM